MTEAVLHPAEDPPLAEDGQDTVFDTHLPNETGARFQTPFQGAAPDALPAFKNFSAAPRGTETLNDIDLIMDIPVQMTVELGRTRIAIRSLMQLAQGSVVELDGSAGAPLKMLVNGRLLAHGEVVVVNSKFGIRLTEIVAPTDRMPKLPQ